VYARLNRAYGWAWQDAEGNLSSFVLVDVERYAGMISGYTADGRKCARPLSEFDALSVDGENWQPLAILLALVPLEAKHVRVRDLPLQVAFDQDQS
jgi:hypothetical protein